MIEYGNNNFNNSIQELVEQYNQMLQTGKFTFFDSHMYLELYEYFYQNLETQKAFDLAYMALDIFPFSSVFYVKLAQLYLDEHKLHKAYEMIVEAKKIEPNSFETCLIEAEILVELSRYQESGRIIEELMPRAFGEDLEDLLLIEAALAERMEDYDKAVHSLQKIISLNNQNEMAFNRLMILIELNEKYSLGIQSCKSILENHPFSYWAWYNLGLCQLRSELFEDAIESFEYAIAINEGFEFAYRDLIEAYFQVEQFEKSRYLIEEYKTIFDSDAEVLFWEAESYEYQENYSKAIELYKKLLKEDHFEGKLFLRLGNCYSELEQWKKANQFFYKAVSADDCNEEFLCALAESYYQLDENEKAKKYFEKAIEISPNSEIAWLSYLEFLYDMSLNTESIELISNLGHVLSEEQLISVQIANLFSLGKKQEAFTLILAWLSNHEKLDYLFDFAPDLKERDDLKQLFIL